MTPPGPPLRCRTVEANVDDALAAFSDDPAPSSSKPAAAAAAVAAPPAPPAVQQQEQQQQQERGPASKRADKLRSGDSTPQRAREAIDLGLEKFQAQDYRAAIDLFQLALEVGGWGGRARGLLRMFG